MGLNPALGASQTIDLASSLPLAGQQVSYQDLLSNTGSVNGSLPTHTLTTGTYFIDKTNFLTGVIGASTITRSSGVSDITRWTICSADWRLIGCPHLGQCGTTIEANRRRR